MSSTQQLLLGEGAGGPKVYIEDVFSTYLYTGTGASLSINNGIDLSTKGGLVWFKRRNTAVGHYLFDTVRGVNKPISTNSTSAQDNTVTDCFNSFNTNGFTLGTDPSGFINFAPDTEVSWTFRKQPKFFDVVTYTGTGSAGLTINHNLGSTPGTIIVKRTDAATSWIVYHRSLGATKFLVLNLTNAEATSSAIWNDTAPTSTQFTLGSGNAAVNASGGTYVAYLFAHDAGGFGLTGTDNVISCGTYTGNSAGVEVNLGYEAQWVMVKNITTTGNWGIYDVMRGMPVWSSGNQSVVLQPNTTAAEASQLIFYPTATGFKIPDASSDVNITGSNYIYIAIRRGPMKVPTDATKVFKSVLWSGNDAASRNISGVGFVPDFANLLVRNASGTYFSSAFYDRLRGAPVLATNSTQSESYWAGTAVNMGAFGQADLTLPSNATQWNASPTTFVGEFFGRAPSFFDEVCYTGTGSAQNLTHNLGAVPELMIVKVRNVGTGAGWGVYAAPIGPTGHLILQTTAAAITTGSTMWNSTAPTSSVFSVGTAGNTNGASNLFVAYLFATCPGVSKVGSYTGTGATQTIACGFTGGARFVLIKRTDSTGDWYVWDTARGMVAGTDPSSLLNSQAAEVNANSVYTVTTGFQIVSTAAGINASGGTYIFLAIA